MRLKLILASVFLLSCSSAFASSVMTTAAPKITLINGYGSTLNFMVKTEGTQDTVSGFPRFGFTLSPGQSISTAVKQSPVDNHYHGGMDDPSAYIGVRAGSETAFFGVGRQDNTPSHAAVSGYIDQGIAYSYNNHEPNVTVVFCKPGYFCQD